MSARSVLIVDDEPLIRWSLAERLRSDGHVAVEASNAAEAMEHAEHGVDLVILDYRLPDGDGLDVCRRARAAGFRQSILMLTAMDQPEDEIEGLSEGADDYLGKPFDLEVLAARARALLRRNEVRAPRELVAGDLRLDPGRRTAWRSSETLTLTTREFTILELLMRTPGGVVSREEILEQAWGEREEPMSNTIDVLVGRLRRKLDRPKQPSRIETVRGMGYRLR